MIATWANAEPAARAHDVSSLCGQVFVPLIRLEALVEQLQCGPEVQQAFAKYLASRRKQLIDRFETMAVPQDGDGRRQSHAGEAHLFIAGGHDVAWQSLRSVVILDSQLVLQHMRKGVVPALSNAVGRVHTWAVPHAMHMQCTCNAHAMRMQVSVE